MSELQTMRDIEVITGEILFFKAQAGGAILEIGRRLIEAKEQLDHGQWLGWLEEKVEFTDRTARRFMRLAKEYSNRTPVSDLGVSKALALLVLPESEREDFISEPHQVNGKEKAVQEMSRRELEQAIRDREEALKRESETAMALGEAEANCVRLERELAEAQEKVSAAQLFSRNATERAAQLSHELEIAKESAQAAVEEHDRLTQELKELRSRSDETDTEAVEAARKAAIAEMTAKLNTAKDAKKQADQKRKTAEEALKAVKKELAELKSRPVEVAVETREPTAEDLEKLTAKAVEEAQASDRERIAAMEKQLAAADGDVSAFRVHYEAWQESFNKMSGYLARISGRDPERAGKLRNAIRAAVERMTE